MKEVDKETIARLRSELARIEQAKSRNHKMAQDSFIAWQQSTVSKVGRAFGYVISAPKNKLIKIWKWLIG